MGLASLPQCLWDSFGLARIFQLMSMMAVLRSNRLQS